MAKIKSFQEMGAHTASRFEAEAKLSRLKAGKEKTLSDREYHITEAERSEAKARKLRSE